MKLKTVKLCANCKHADGDIKQSWHSYQAYGQIMYCTWYKKRVDSGDFACKYWEDYETI